MSGTCESRIAGGTIRPSPILTEDNEAYWRAAQEHRLVVQRCSQCRAYLHPPRPMCPHCHSLDLVQVDVRGSGVVYSFTILHYPQHPSFSYPVIAVLVELDEGVRILANLEGVAPEDLAIGMAVAVDFVPAEYDSALPVFRRTGSAP